MIFSLSDNWKTLFFTQIYRYPEAWCNRLFSAFFETDVLKEDCILYLLSPQQHHKAANTMEL